LARHGRLLSGSSKENSVARDMGLLRLLHSLLDIDLKNAIDIFVLLQSYVRRSQLVSTPANVAAIESKNIMAHVWAAPSEQSDCGLS
jgi:hypothetical protein